MSPDTTRALHTGISVGVDLLQTLSMFKSFAFSWPRVVDVTLSATAASTFNIDLVSPECSISITFVEKWYILQVFPVICASCLVFGILTSTVVSEARHMWAQRMMSKMNRSVCRRAAWRSAYDNIIGGVFTVAYYTCVGATCARAHTQVDR